MHKYLIDVTDELTGGNYLHRNTTKATCVEYCRISAVNGGGREREGRREGGRKEEKREREGWRKREIVTEIDG